jgi:hypothetical protein
LRISENRQKNSKATKFFKQGIEELIDTLQIVVNSSEKYIFDLSVFFFLYKITLKTTLLMG